MWEKTKCGIFWLWTAHKSDNKKTNIETCKKDIERERERVPSWMLYMPRIVCYRLEKNKCQTLLKRSTGVTEHASIWETKRKEKKRHFLLFLEPFQTQKKIKIQSKIVLHLFFFLFVFGCEIFIWQKRVWLLGGNFYLSAVAFIHPARFRRSLHSLSQSIHM